MSDEALAIIRDYLREQSEGAMTVELDDNLVARGIIDSIGVLRMVIWLEERFDIAIPDEDVTLENFGTLQTCADYVEWRRLV